MVASARQAVPLLSRSIPQGPATSAHDAMSGLSVQVGAVLLHSLTIFCDGISSFTACIGDIGGTTCASRGVLGATDQPCGIKGLATDQALCWLPAGTVGVEGRAKLSAWCFGTFWIVDVGLGAVPWGSVITVVTSRHRSLLMALGKAVLTGAQTGDAVDVWKVGSGAVVGDRVAVGATWGAHARWTRCACSRTFTGLQMGLPTGQAVSTAVSQ